MSKKLTLTAFFAILTFGLFSQRPTMELTYTATNITTYVQLDSIKIMNHTQGGDTILYWPDTVLSIYYIGIHENSLEKSTFKVFQNYPNPVEDLTTVSLYVPEKDKVSINVSDILGRMIVQSERVLDKGKHSFRFTPGSGNLYIFSAQWQGCLSSIKISNFSTGGNACSLEYRGDETSERTLKATGDDREFLFSFGDELLYIGYANGFQSGILNSPEESTTYAFQFATNIPCPGAPTVEYEGQVYNTIQIFSQCWLKENLNVGGMINGTIEQSDNGTIEKYCYNNEPDSCTKYGGLYQWNEMMQYTTQQGAQGICPPGWYLPTDEEWKVLEGSVDSQYGIGDSEWDLCWDFRGYDAGTKLKTTSGWHNNGNGTDLFGFSGLPGGSRSEIGSFDLVRYDGYYMSSTEYDYYEAIGRDLFYNSPAVYWYYNWKVDGFSVRCLRDY